MHRSLPFPLFQTDIFGASWNVALQFERLWPRVWILALRVDVRCHQPLSTAVFYFSRELARWCLYLESHSFVRAKDGGFLFPKWPMYSVLDGFGMFWWRLWLMPTMPESWMSHQVSCSMCSAQCVNMTPWQPLVMRLFAGSVKDAKRTVQASVFEHVWSCTICTGFWSLLIFFLKPAKCGDAVPSWTPEISDALNWNELHVPYCSILFHIVPWTI